MPNLIWPRALSSQVGTTGFVGRAIHWLGLAIAAAILVTALGLAADDWAMPLAGSLALAAIAMALAARGVRYLLAKE
jgi:hypothetical protein